MKKIAGLLLTVALLAAVKEKQGASEQRKSAPGDRRRFFCAAVSFKVQENDGIPAK